MWLTELNPSDRQVHVCMVAFSSPPLNRGQGKKEDRSYKGPLFATVGLQPEEAPALEPLGQQGQILAIGSQHHEDVAASAAEDEDVAAEAISHVGVASGNPHAGAARDVREKLGAWKDDYNPSSPPAARSAAGPRATSTQIARPGEFPIPCLCDMICDKRKLDGLEREQVNTESSMGTTQ